MYYFLILVMTLMGSIASIFFKRASGSDGMTELLKNRNLYFGGFLYLSAALLNIVVLRYLDYSIVLPLTSITYIWTMFLSHFILKEKFTIRKLSGVLLIFIGAVLITL